jgi:hypothetical protein
MERATAVRMMAIGSGTLFGSGGLDSACFVSATLSRAKSLILLTMVPQAGLSCWHTAARYANERPFVEAWLQIFPGSSQFIEPSVDAE